jgi:SAM-dependent methyltransferase
VQVPQQQQLSVEAEREYYGTHRNAVDDPGYRAWLGRLAEPLLERVRPPASGLDFGCGPAPEVLEHLRAPAVELQQLWECLRPGGWLALMTRRLPADPAAFAAWHYRRDPTHIGFFADASFAWLAQHWEARLELLDDDVALLRKA